MTTIRIAHHPSAIAAPGKAFNITLWTLQALVALAFVAAAAGKLLGNADMIALFDAVGVGQWFRYVTGSLELLGALLLIVPGRAAFGSVLLAGVMVGAVVAHPHRVQAQSSIRRPGTFPNSFALWVINCTSRLIAWAAINRSMDPIGCPFFSSMVRTRPYTAVASRSNEATSSGETNCSKAARFLAGRLLLAMPYSSSANVMTDTPMSPTECAVNRSRTEAGCSLIR